MKAVMITTKDGAKFLIDELGDEIEKEDIVLKIVSDEEFASIVSKKVDIDIDISDEQFMELAKMAHEKDITLNQMVNNILRDKIERLKDESRENDFLEGSSR